MNFDEKLIEEVKKHPSLYQKSTGGYKNMAEKIQIWNKIAEQLSSTDEICQNRWRCLRDRFGREKKKIHFSSGSQETESAWPYWSRMEFLKDYVKAKMSTVGSAIDNGSYNEMASKTNALANNKESSQITLGNETVNSKRQNISTPPPAKKVRLHDKILPELTKTMECFKNYLAQKEEINQEPRESSQQVFCNAIGDIIDNLQPRNQVIAKAQILQYLSDLQLKELNATDNIQLLCA